MKFRAIVKDNDYNTIKNFDVDKLEDLFWLYNTIDGLRYDVIKIFKYEEA